MFNTIVTTHALLIIFFITIPTLIGGFGNYLLPLQLGNPDLIFPRLNLLSLSLLPGAFLFLVTRIFCEGGRGTR